MTGALYVCPVCGADRDDYEVDPLNAPAHCPSCGEDAVPVPWMSPEALLTDPVDEED